MTDLERHADLGDVLKGLAEELATTYNPTERHMIIRQIEDIRAVLIPPGKEEYIHDR